MDPMPVGARELFGNGGGPGTPAVFQPPFETAKNPPSRKIRPSSDQPLHPFRLPVNAKKPPQTPPAYWALPRRHHSPAETRRARGASAPGSREEAGGFRR